MTWTYLGVNYKTLRLPIYYNGDLNHQQCDWDFLNAKSKTNLFYHKRWDKCYFLEVYGWHGNGNKLKAFIRDIYSGRCCWTLLEDLELVVEN